MPCPCPHDSGQVISLFPDFFFLLRSSLPYKDSRAKLVTFAMMALSSPKPGTMGDEVGPSGREGSELEVTGPGLMAYQLSHFFLCDSGK